MDDPAALPPPQRAFKGLRATYQEGHIILAIPEEEVFGTLSRGMSADTYPDPRHRTLFFETVVTAIATAVVQDRDGNDIEPAEPALRYFIRDMAQRAHHWLLETEDDLGSLEPLLQARPGKQTPTG